VFEKIIQLLLDYLRNGKCLRIENLNPLTANIAKNELRGAKSPSISPLQGLDN